MISVITINYDLSNETIPCVESVLASEYKDISIFLIDNGSELADYKKLVKHFGGNTKVNILRIEKNLGYVGGINFGLQKAMENRPDYFMVMNNDTIIDKKAITYLLDTVKQHHNKAIVSGKVYYYDHPNILQHTGVVFKDNRYLTTSYPGANEKDIGQCDEETERDSLDDVFWLLPAQLVNEVGFYSNFFFLYAEQGDYAQRARRKGYKLIFTPEAKIWHKDSMTTGGGNTHALPIYYWRGQGIFVFQYRNLKTKYFIVFMFKNFAKYIARSILKKGLERKRAIAMLRGYLWGFIWMFNKRVNDGYNPYIKHIK